MTLLPDIAVRSPLTSPLRVERSAGSVVALVTARKAARSGVSVGTDLRPRDRLVGDQLRQDLYQLGSARRLGRHLRIEQGDECTLRSGSSAPDRGWLHGLQDLHDAHGPRCGVGAPDQHEVAPWRGGLGPLGPPTRGPDHPAARRRPGHRRPRGRSPHPLDDNRHHRPSCRDGPRTCGSLRVPRCTSPWPWWRQPSCSWPSGPSPASWPPPAAKPPPSAPPSSG